VKTKFEQHSQQGQFVVNEVKRVMDAIYDKSLKTRAEKMLSRKEVQDKFNFTEQQLMLLTQEMKDKIHQMVEDVEQRVGRILMISLQNYCYLNLIEQGNVLKLIL
jgi:mitofusin 2